MQELFNAPPSHAQHMTIKWSLFALLILSAASTEAQFTKVKGEIRTSGDVPVVNAEVRVRIPNSKPPDAAFIKQQAPTGTYFIGHLQEGTYDFIGCGIPYVPDVHSKVTVRSDERPEAINFVLKIPSKKHSLPLQSNHSDTFLYLKDPATGCLVAQAHSDAHGNAKFTNWEWGDDICVEDEHKPKEYLCFQRISSP